jgi:transcriptional regulator with XRE-family HTH domain
MAEDLPETESFLDTQPALIQKVAETMGVTSDTEDAGAAVEFLDEAGEAAERSVMGAYSQQVINNVRSIRRERGLSARQLAELCQTVCTESGVSHTLNRVRIGKLENGLVGSLSVDELIVVSRALELSVAEVLGNQLSDPRDEADRARRLQGGLAKMREVLRALEADGY